MHHIERLCLHIDVALMSKQTFLKAMKSGFSDYEDALQYITAKDAGADVIITRNISDYKNGSLPVMSAEQFLNVIIR